MKFKKLIFFLLVISLVGLLSNTDSWAITAYMKVEGEQGEIPGGTTIEGYENWITVASFGHSINIPTDPQSGQPAGTREHGSLRIVKPLDKASPLLYKALVRGERLPVVEIRFLRLSPEGQMELGKIAADHLTKVKQLKGQIDRNPVLAEVFATQLTDMMGYLTVMMSGKYEEAPPG